MGPHPAMLLSSRPALGLLHVDVTTHAWGYQRGLLGEHRLSETPQGMGHILLTFFLNHGLYPTQQIVSARHTTQASGTCCPKGVCKLSPAGHCDTYHNPSIWKLETGGWGTSQLQGTFEASLDYLGHRLKSNSSSAS